MESIIFDLDGTLWDSREVVARSWNQTIQRLGYDKSVTVDDLTKVMGLQMDEIGEILLSDLSTEVQATVMHQCGVDEIDFILKYGGHLYPDLRDTLAYLNEKYRLFIVSNCQKGYIESFYAYHQLGDFFQDEENPGRTGLSKGENIRLVMDRNDIKDAVYIGDTRGDQRAATDAGLPFVYASYGFGQVDDFARKIQSVAELKHLF